MNEIWNNEFEDEKSISLMDMLFYILRQWKKMLIVAAVMALVAVAVGVFSGFGIDQTMKIVIVAAVAGAIATAVICAIVYLFNGRIHNKEELGSYMRLPIFDMASDRKKGNTPEMLAVLLAGHLNAHGLEKVYLSGSLGRQQVQLLNTLKELVEKKGFTAEVGKSILTDAGSLQKAADCGCMVFVEKCHESKDKDLREEISKAMFCGIRVLGVILEN